VSEISISANQIQGRMFSPDGDTEKGTLFRTVRVDPDISAFLDENNIPFAGQIESNVLGNLLSWIVPLFMFFWHLVFHDAPFPTVVTSSQDVSYKGCNGANGNEALKREEPSSHLP
jgi:hypothetical protein